MCRPRATISSFKSLSPYFPKVGYCQGINFSPGFLLVINRGNELGAFWTIVTLFRDKGFL
jgi:GTPase-activating protein